LIRVFRFYAPDWSKSLDAGMAPALWFRNFFYWIFTPGFFARPEVVAQALRLPIDYPYPQSQARFRGQVAAMRGFDRRAGLADMRAPTRVLGCERDLVFRPRTCSRICSPCRTRRR
jgi:hypothetical protein